MAPEKFRVRIRWGEDFAARLELNYYMNTTGSAKLGIDEYEEAQFTENFYKAVFKQVCPLGDHEFADQIDIGNAVNFRLRVGILPKPIPRSWLRDLRKFN